MIGIYSIINLVTGKRYVGSASVVDRRWRAHKAMLNRKTHHAHRLQNDWILFGSTTFKFELTEQLNNEEDLEVREQYWINYFDATNPDKGYNEEPDAIRHTHSEETRAKISKSNKALNRKYVPTPETIERLRESHLGQLAWNKGLKIPKTKRNCLECDKEFELEYKTSKAKFCSKSCKSRFDGRRFSELTNIIKKCRACKQQFKTIQSQNNDYCSRTCYYKSMVGNKRAVK